MPDTLIDCDTDLLIERDVDWLLDAAALLRLIDHMRDTLPVRLLLCDMDIERERDIDMLMDCESDWEMLPDFDAVMLAERDFDMLWLMDWLFERCKDCREMLSDIDRDRDWLRLRDSLGLLPNTERLTDALIERDIDRLSDAVLCVPHMAIR